MKPCKIWIDQCEAARDIDDEFGTDKALDYLIGEKFINFLEAAGHRPQLIRSSASTLGKPPKPFVRLGF